MYVLQGIKVYHDHSMQWTTTCFDSFLPNHFILLNDVRSTCSFDTTQENTFPDRVPGPVPIGFYD